jgi:hypothetical protein
MIDSDDGEVIELEKPMIAQRPKYVERVGRGIQDRKPDILGISGCSLEEARVNGIIEPWEEFGRRPAADEHHQQDNGQCPVSGGSVLVSSPNHGFARIIVPSPGLIKSS